MLEAKIGILLVNYKKADDTIECIRSLKNLNYNNFVIIVLDNQSDGSLERDLKNDVLVTLISAEENLGFGGANNLGYRLALEMGCNFVWILNNDTVVMPDTLHRLIDTMCRPGGKTAVVGGVLRYHSDLEIQAVGGGRINWWLGFAPLAKSPSRELDFISGACMLVNPSLMGDTLFDPLYFMYWEDTDLCLQLKRRGYRLGVSEQALVLHKESASLGKFNPVLETHYGRSMTLFFLRHSTFPLIPLLSGLTLRAGRRVARGRVRSSAALLNSALKTFIRYRKAMR